MFKKLNRALVSAALLATTFVALPSAVAAPMIQGFVGAGKGTALAAEFTSIRSVSGGTGTLDDATIICIDMLNHFPSTGSLQTYTVLDSDMAPVVHTEASGRATDLFHYAVDNYYLSMVVNESGNSTGRQFSGLMWEIQQDFTGNASSLDAFSGNLYFAQLGLGDGALAYQTMVHDLRENYATIGAGYRSKQYALSFLDDNQAGYQTMMMLTEVTTTSEVPEPGTLALSMLGGLAMWRRARRQRTQA